MQVVAMEPDRIERLWPVIVRILWPAIRQDPTYNVQSLYHRLTDEKPTAILFEVDEGAKGLWVVTLAEDGGMIAWTTAIAGTINGGPKARLGILRQAVEAIENVARQAGCKAHRICGRDWSKLLPGYTPYEGARNGIERLL